MAGDGLDLLLTFLAAVTGQPLQSGDGHSQQLDDNRTVDIRLDAQGKHGGGGKSAAAHHVVKAQQAGAPDLHLQGQSVPVDIGHHDGVAETENQQDQESKNDLFPQLRDAPCFANGLDHFTSPLPFRPLPR